MGGADADVEHRDGEYGGDMIRARVGGVDEGVLRDEVARILTVVIALCIGGMRSCSGKTKRALKILSV